MFHRFANDFTIVVILLTLLSAPLTGPAFSQENSPDAEAALAGATEQEVGKKAAELLDQLEILMAEAKVYNKKLSAAGTEDSLVLQLQLATRQDHFMDVLHQLADIVPEPGEDQSNTQLLNRAAVVFESISPAIWSLISDLRSQIDVFRSERPETSPADRAVLENNILRATTRLDRFFQFGGDHIQKMEAMGLDVAADRALFNNLLSGRADELSGRVDLVFGISYSDDIPNAEKVLNDILAGHEMVLDDPEPMVRVHTLGESSVDFIVRPWVKTEDYWETHWAITKAVKMRFDAEGISIPFPQRDVHLFETKLAHHSDTKVDEKRSSKAVAQDPDEIADDEG